MAENLLRKKFMDLKVVELRSELEKLGLDKNGIKSVLVDRLVAHCKASESEGGVAESVQSESDTGIDLSTKEVITANQEDAVAVAESVDSTTTGGEAEVLVEENEDSNIHDGEEGGVAVDAVLVDENEEEEGVEGVGENEDSTADVEDEEDASAMANEEQQNENEEEETPCGVENDEEETPGVENDEDESNQRMEEEQPSQGIPETTEEQAEAEANMEEQDADGDADADALNITVEESEVLGIEQDDKAPDDEEGASGEKSEDLDESNNATATKQNEGDQESKAQAAEASTEESTTANNKEDSKEEHILLVAGLSRQTSANDLKTFFRLHGKIGRIKIMTNSRLPGSPRFAHILVPNEEELNNLVEKVNGYELKGGVLKLTKAPDNGSTTSSYIEVATQDGKSSPSPGKSGANATNESQGASSLSPGGDSDKEKDPNQHPGNKDENWEEGPSASATDGDGDKEKEKKKSQEGSQSSGKDKDKDSSHEGKSSSSRNSGDKGGRPKKEPSGRPLHPQDRHRDRHPRLVRGNFRRDMNAGGNEWRRRGPPPPRGPPMEVTRVQRDRPPIGRGHSGSMGGRRRSPLPHHGHQQLTFEQIREIREDQRRREVERRKREEERERAAEVERQKRLEYQNYMEFKHLEREREKLRQERERIEKDKLELIRLERERQRAEREKIEKEREELRRAKLNIDHRPPPPPSLKRPYEDDKDRRREPDDRKKPYVVARSRPDGKTEAERTIERERYERGRLHGGHATERSPPATVARDSRRDAWAREDRGERAVRGEERGGHRSREPVEKSERRAREAPSRPGPASGELASRYSLEGAHSAGRSMAVPKRVSDRYDEGRSTARDADWALQRSAYMAPGSSMSLPMPSASAGRGDSWPMNERKIEAWDTARLPPRTEQWISGAGAALGGSSRSTLPVLAPPPPMYSHAAASLALPGNSLSLGNYASSGDRYDYKGSGFQHLRRF